MGFIIPPDESVEAYQRVEETESAFSLTPWSDTERSLWGLPPMSETPALSGGDQVVRPTFPRAVVARYFGVSEQELHSMCVTCGVSTDSAELMELEVKSLKAVVAMAKAGKSSAEIYQVFRTDAAGGLR